MVHDPVRAADVVLYPEGVMLLNETAADILRLCDGERTAGEIAAELAAHYDGVIADSVGAQLDELAAQRILTEGGQGNRPLLTEMLGQNYPAQRSPVLTGVIAELTYRCPLRCTYCANPVSLESFADELGTDDWLRLLEEARALGALQVHFSGGEPLLRRDLPDLVAHAQALGMYTNLITSGIPLTEAKLALLLASGLDHFQLSIQGTDRAAARAVAGIEAYERKLAAAAMAASAGLPLTINVVLHKENVDRITQIAEQAMLLGADRLELAHTQFYGWAWRNRTALMPQRDQIDSATRAAETITKRFSGAMEIVYVQPDYHIGSPKPCMNGWGSRQLAIAPNGDALPCLAAAQLAGLDIPNTRRESLRDIWYDSAAFNRFRGTGWLPEPCQSCALRDVDFGGCRCQAFQLTGDAANTDPVCSLSPLHSQIQLLLKEPATVAIPRRFP